jgi:hypothetical protein
MLKIKIYKIISPIMYGDEMCSPALSEGHKLKVFENEVLRKIFRPNMREVREQHEILHKKKSHDLRGHLICYDNKIKKTDGLGMWIG